jgi:predicted small secreted protein
LHLRDLIIEWKSQERGGSMKQKSLMLILSLVTLFAFTLAACSNPTGNDGQGSSSDYQFDYLRIEVDWESYEVVLSTEWTTSLLQEGENFFMFSVTDSEEGTEDQQIDPGTYTYEGDLFSDFVPTRLWEGRDEDADTFRFAAEPKTEEESELAAKADTYEEIISGTLIVDYEETTDTYSFDWTLGFASGNSLSGTYTGVPDDIWIW